MSEAKKQRLSSEQTKENLSENVESNSENTRISTFEPPRLKRTWHQTKEALFQDRLLAACKYDWKPIQSEDLNVRYAKIFSNSEAYSYLTKLEAEIEYMSPELSKVRVFGKWFDIPRKQAAYGDDGLTYKFSGNTVTAKPWKCCPTLIELKKLAESATGQLFNFVLVNRYKDGNDYMGEHRDDEKDLVHNSSIASFSFGQARDFVLRHKDNRNKNNKRPDVPTIKQNLESGSLLIMEPPTNYVWYHGLPVRKNAPGVRVNLTFRRMVEKNIPV